MLNTGEFFITNTNKHKGETETKEKEQEKGYKEKKQEDKIKKSNKMGNICEIEEPGGNNEEGNIWEDEDIMRGIIEKVDKIEREYGNERKYEAEKSTKKREDKTVEGKIEKQENKHEAAEMMARGDGVEVMRRIMERMEAEKQRKDKQLKKIETEKKEKQLKETETEEEKEENEGKTGKTGEDNSERNSEKEEAEKAENEVQDNTQKRKIREMQDNTQKRKIREMLNTTEEVSMTNTKRHKGETETKEREEKSYENEEKQEPGGKNEEEKMWEDEDIMRGVMEKVEQIEKEYENKEKNEAKQNEEKLEDQAKKGKEENRNEKTEINEEDGVEVIRRIMERNKHKEMKAEKQTKGKAMKKEKQLKKNEERNGKKEDGNEILKEMLKRLEELKYKEKERTITKGKSENQEQNQEGKENLKKEEQGERREENINGKSAITEEEAEKEKENKDLEEGKAENRKEKGNLKEEKQRKGMTNMGEPMITEDKSNNRKGKENLKEEKQEKRKENMNEKVTIPEKSSEGGKEDKDPDKDPEEKEQDKGEENANEDSEDERLREEMRQMFEGTYIRKEKDENKNKNDKNKERKRKRETEETKNNSTKIRRKKGDIKIKEDKEKREEINKEKQAGNKNKEGQNINEEKQNSNDQNGSEEVERNINENKEKKKGKRKGKKNRKKRQVNSDGKEERIQKENKGRKEEQTQKDNEKKERKWLKSEIKGGFQCLVGQDIDIPENVRILLSMGEDYVIPYRGYRKGDIMEMLEDIERKWEVTKVTDKKWVNIGKWKNELLKEMLEGKHKEYNEKEKEIMEAVLDVENFIRKNKKLTVQQADKGKKTIIMEKEKLKIMTDDFIEKAIRNGLYKIERKIEGNEGKITTEKNREIATIIGKVKDWEIEGIYKERSERNIGKERKFYREMRRTLVETTDIPKMRFLVKAHKIEKIGVRNIIPKDGTWTYGLSQQLKIIIKDAVNIGNGMKKYRNTNIKDMVRWTWGIQNREISDKEEMVLLDIKEMFNKIDRRRLIEIIKSSIRTEIYKESTIMEMIWWDLEGASRVEYDGKIMVQIGGIPMGAPTSSLYAEIYTDHYITWRWEEMKEEGMITIDKYVDDMFVVARKGKIGKIKEILEDSMKLEIEIEKISNEEVEYLDIKIIRNEEKKLETKRNKKPYMSNRMIHRTTSQPKTLIINTAINRIRRSIGMTSARYLDEAIQTNIEELRNNGYELKEIGFIIRKAKEKELEAIKNKELEERTIKIVEEKRQIMEENEQAVKMQIELEKRKEAIERRKREEMEEREKEENEKKKREEMMRKEKGNKKKRSRRVRIKRKRNNANKNQEKWRNEGETKIIRIPHEDTRSGIAKKWIKTIFKNTAFATTTRADKRMGAIIRKCAKASNENQERKHKNRRNTETNSRNKQRKERRKRTKKDEGQ